MNGTFYGIGVGPGDPELLTLKAVRLIRECDVVAAPDGGTGEQVALAIAAAHVGDKPVLRLHLPMTRDAAVLAHCRSEAADAVCAHLREGRSVAFLTLGDPTVYSTYSYLHKAVAARGFAAEMVPGVPSFCAAAAALGEPLCEAGQPLHILPASYGDMDQALALDGVRVLMKAGKSLPEVLGLLRERGELPRAALAERVGMPEQRLLHTLEGDEASSYFTIVIVKPEEEAT